MGGGGPLPAVPDWKTYKVGPHTPELEHVQRMLKSLGLKDPWARNEVWRYDRNQFGMADRSVQIKRLVSRGFFPGLGLAVVTAGIHYFLESKNDHGHH
eukprot:TRINITY_DN14496_c0_g1_i1.p1 TRINITY_DN14496_c0_g1~~TRINITY_DN14496_c0_g1_i1.p1  ORF type:complete len:107 (+),score=21.13 TRINITY_DN14496_c0_g1_i1:30-323(+)